MDTSCPSPFWILVILIWIPCTWTTAFTLSDLDQRPGALQELDPVSTDAASSSDFMKRDDQSLDDKVVAQEEARLLLMSLLDPGLVRDYLGTIGGGARYSVPFFSESMFRPTREEDQSDDTILKRNAKRFFQSKRQLNAIEKAVIRQEIRRRLQESNNPVEIPIGLRFRRVSASPGNYAAKSSSHGYHPFLDAFYSPVSHFGGGTRMIGSSMWKSGAPKGIYLWK